jgi:hypothetical protein
MKAALAGHGRCVCPPTPSTIKPSSQMNEKQKGTKNRYLYNTYHTREIKDSDLDLLVRCVQLFGWAPQKKI